MSKKFSHYFFAKFLHYFFAKFFIHFFAKFSHNFFHKIFALILHTFLHNRLKQNFAKKAKIFAFFTSERKARRSKKKQEEKRKLNRKNWKESIRDGDLKEGCSPPPRKYQEIVFLLRRNSRVNNSI